VNRAEVLRASDCGRLVQKMHAVWERVVKNGRHTTQRPASERPNTTCEHHLPPPSLTPSFLSDASRSFLLLPLKSPRSLCWT